MLHGRFDQIMTCQMRLCQKSNEIKNCMPNLIMAKNYKMFCQEEPHKNPIILTILILKPSESLSDVELLPTSLSESGEIPLIKLVLCTVLTTMKKTLCQIGNRDNSQEQAFLLASRKGRPMIETNLQQYSDYTWSLLYPWWNS